MAHKRKKRRTQAPGQPGSEQANGVSKTNPAERTPRSMVIRIGASDVGPSVSQLVKDVRKVMEPHTASRLKERRSNKLRDYKSMAGPLGVSHFLLFSRSNAGNTNLRMAITPRGPTLSFQVEKYSLCSDVAKTQKRPKASGGGVEHLSPPLLVMNNFTTPDSTATTSIPKHLENLATTVFQSLFPAISPQRTPLSSIRRVLLVNREPPPKESAQQGTYVLSFRHYAITTRPLVPLSRGLKRLRAASAHSRARGPNPLPARNSDVDAPTGATKPKSSKKSLPNLSRLDDVADYLLDPAAAGYTSASETDADTDVEVEVLEPSARRVLNRRERAQQAQQQRTGPDNGAGDNDAEEQPQPQQEQPQRQRTPPPAQKRAIKLTELGPRMKLRLVKVEEGMCEGKVLWHEFVTKTAAEEKALDEIWEVRRREREERRRVQRENVERKRVEKGEGKGHGKGGEGPEGEEDVGADGEVDDDEWDDDFDDDEMMLEAADGDGEDKDMGEEA